MAKLEDLGVTITYQGKACFPQFQYNRNAGLEPDFGWVALHRDDFKDFVISESMPGADLLDGAAPGAPSKGLLSSGQLVFKEVVSDDEQYVTAWDFVLVSERAIESVVADDLDTSEVCRVELTDIRYLWKNRGEVVGWINNPKLGTPPAPSGGSGTVDRGAPQYIAGTVDPVSGKPWTLDRVLRAKVLPNLPGKPQLVIDPGQKIDHFAKVVGPKTWDGILAKDALQQLIDEFQLVFVLNPGSASDLQGNKCPSVSLWQENDGGLRVQEYAQSKGGAASAASAPYEIKNFLPVEKGVANPNCDPRIANARQSCGFKHIPVACAVRGVPTIKSARVLLEAVGINSAGQIVPLVQALADIGLDEPRARKFALLPKEERSALLGVSDAGLKEFDRWAFKMFRLTGGAERNSDRLPILDSTAAVDATNQLLPLRVYSEGHAVVRRLDLLNASTPAGAVSKAAILQKDRDEINERIAQSNSLEEVNALRQKEAELAQQIDELGAFAANQLARISPEVKAAQDALARAKAAATLTSTFNGPGPVQTSFEEQADRLAIEAAEAQLQAALKLATGIADQSVKKAFSEEASSQIQQALNQHLRAVVNVPFGFAASGYRIDHARGLVIFEEAQGNVIESGAALAEASLKPIDLIRVELEFAYRMKPPQTEDLSLDFRYAYVLVRKRDGSFEPRNVVPDGVAPIRVFRPELQLIVNLDGSSNKESLDAIAKKLAEQQLTGPRSTTGAVVEFCRPVSVLNTGVCLSVNTSYGTDEIPGVQAHLSNFARFAPVGSSLRTRGLGAQGGLDDFDGGTLHGHVNAPRGPRQ